MLGYAVSKNTSWQIIEGQLGRRKRVENLPSLLLRKPAAAGRLKNPCVSAGADLAAVGVLPGGGLASSRKADTPGFFKHP
jgi:hypothetical protein